ncbi:MAG: antibiotic biosynthesis monooxygenase [Pirellulales bacterium]|nr:antibiotic biosynthesis monooxygenase [Pirellulales bacterium]
MIFIIARIELREGRRDEFLDVFKKLAPMVRKESGCIDYWPTIDFETNIPVQGPVNENVVTVVERWESIDALEAHLMAPHMLEYHKRVKEMVVRTTLQVLEPA